MKYEKNKSVVMRFRTTPKGEAEIVQAAQENGLSVSELIRRALQRELAAANRIPFPEQWQGSEIR